MQKGLLMVALLGALVSCGGNKKVASHDPLPPSRFNINANEPSYKLQDEEGDILWYVNFGWFGSRNGEDYVSKIIKANTNTNIIFISGDDDRLNQMIASGEMPDIVTADKNTSFAKSADRWAVPLNLLADTYDPYFYQVAKTDSLEWYRDEEGNVYGYPSGSNSYDDYMRSDTVVAGGEALLIREDIYNAIGRPSMRTPESFLQALRDAKAYQPNVIPLAIENLMIGGALVNTLMNFLALSPIQDDSYYERIFDPEYLRWMDTLRVAYNEGLIIDDNFTWKPEMFDEGIAQSSYFAMLTMHWQSNPVIRNARSNPTQRYIAVDGPANSNFDDPTFWQSGISGWTQTFVTQQSHKKERAIQLLTYLMSTEGHIATIMGIEGESYYVGDDGLFHFTPEFAQRKLDDLDKFNRETQFGEVWMVKDDSFTPRYTNTIAPEVLPIVQWTRGKQKPMFILENTDPEPRTNAERNWLNYEQERKEVAVRMLRSKTHEQMMQELAKLQELYQSPSIQEVITIKNEKIKKNLAKIQKMGYNQ